MALFEKVWQQMNSHLDQSKTHREVERLRQSLQQKPNDPEILRQLGTTCEAYGMRDEAIYYFVKLAESYQQVGQSSLAIAYYRKAEKIAGLEARASILKEIEKIHHQSQQFEEAYRVSRQVIEIYLEIGQKEAARGFLQSLSPLGEKDAILRKELREMIGERDSNWAKGARGSWVDEDSIKPTEQLDSLPGYQHSRIPVTADFEKGQFAQMSVLIVDDDPGILKIMGAMLRSLGCKVIMAADGLEGLEKAKEFRPNLIISDLLMPNMDGSQLFDKLQELEVTKDVPFVCLTSRGQEDEKLAAFEKGVEDYWVKPFVISELSVRTKKLLQKQLKSSNFSVTDNLSQADFVGNIQNTEISQLLRMLAYLRKTGVLRVEQNSQEGFILFQLGEVIDARFGNTVGEPALIPLLFWQEGTFAFRSISIPTNRTISLTMEDIFHLKMQYQQQQSVLTNLPSPNTIVIFSAKFDQALVNERFPREIDRLIEIVDGRNCIADCVRILNQNKIALDLFVELYQRELIINK